MFNFTDRVVMITGASGGLGQTVARAFAQAGAQLHLIGRSEERIQQALPALAKLPDVRINAADITDPQAARAAVADTLAHFGHLDVLVNTVGGYKAGTPVHQTPIQTWDLMFDLNARTAFNISQAVVPTMLAQHAGSIVHVAARAALAGSKHAAAYSASKSALVRLTESLAAELKAQHINVNCILPGIIDTPANRAAMPKADFGTWASPKAIAQVILFLASDAARVIHGAAIPVYGLS